MLRIIVTDFKSDWKFSMEGVEIVSSQDYINSDRYKDQWNVRVINLCRSYQYQSNGYYISLLAEARGHKVIPEVSTMIDLKLPHMVRDDAQDFDKVIQDSLDKKGYEQSIEFNIYFGFTADNTLNRVAQLIFNLYQIPAQKVAFLKKEKWQLVSLKPLNIKDLEQKERENLDAALKLFLAGKNVVRKSYKRKKFDLAILINPDDANPPSDPRALQKFVKAAEKTGFNVEFLTKSDFGKIAHFDALFIRETTKVNHHTFRFARKAEYEGLAVIDDPNSILKCTNKVYLKELMEANDIPIPKSAIIYKNMDLNELADFHYPFILKQPDGAFSKGVKRVENETELKLYMSEFFDSTDMLIAQEFMPTDFDWRVGVLDGEIIYVCKYFMARNHWQIVDWKKSGYTRMGKTETIKTEIMPKRLKTVARKAAALIGDGLYGVDIKEVKGKFYVIEINDNPNIDAGIEDRENKDLYDQIMKLLMKRVLY